MFPTWIPDAEPPNDLYKGQDTQVDCDGIEIFDSPGFDNDLPDVEQRFTGITLEIIPAGPGGQPKATVLGAAHLANLQNRKPAPSILGALPRRTSRFKPGRQPAQGPPVEYGFNPDF